MDLKLTQENFSKALSIVARIASSRSTLPILNNILIKTTGNRLMLSATNLDIAITEFVGAKVDKEGSLTVPARLLQDYISNLGEGTITLKQTKNRLDIKSDNNKSTFNGVSSEDFPVMPEISEGKEWSVDSGVLREALMQVAFAASKDDTRPILTGVLIKNDGDTMFVAATDSYRLAEKKTKLKQQPSQFLIPANAALELLRVLVGDGDVQVSHDEQQVKFQTSTTELIARIIEGEYPDYQKLIPSNFSSTATVDKSDLVNITKISSLFARESAGSVILRLDKSTSKVTIQSISSQIGENSSSADAEVEQDGEITLNSNYLLEAIQAIHGNKVQISFNGKLDPLVLSNPKITDYKHIVMPLNN